MTKKQKKFLLLTAALALLLAGVSGTVAYIVAHTDPVVNTFEATNVEVQVQGDKSIKNTGSIDAYIRAAVVATWQKDGSVHATAPTLKVDEANGWAEDDGFYYCTSKVPAGQSTNPLSISTSGTAPSGYSLTVEILAQGIQAEPSSVISTVWGYDPDGN